MSRQQLPPGYQPVPGGVPPFPGPHQLPPPPPPPGPGFQPAPPPGFGPLAGDLQYQQPPPSADETRDQERHVGGRKSHPRRKKHREALPENPIEVYDDRPRKSKSRHRQENGRHHSISPAPRVPDLRSYHRSKPDNPALMNQLYYGHRPSGGKELWSKPHVYAPFYKEERSEDQRKRGEPKEYVIARRKPTSKAKREYNRNRSPTPPPSDERDSSWFRWSRKW